MKYYIIIPEDQINNSTITIPAGITVYNNKDKAIKKAIKLSNETSDSIPQHIFCLKLTEIFDTL